MKDEYVSLKRLAEVHAKHFAIAAKSRGEQKEKIMLQVCDLNKRILNDEEVGLLVENINEALQKLQEALDRRIEEISYDVAYNIPPLFPHKES